MSIEISKPSRLKQGDSVALVSPVNLPPKEYRADESIMLYLDSVGYKPLLFIASADTEKSRIDNFNNAINSGARALLPISGNRYGENLFHRLNYEAFEREKPIYCTFSAASALLLALHFRTGVTTFYGPHISFIHTQATFRENNFTVSSFWDTLTGRYEDVIRNLYSLPETPSDGENIPFVGINESQSRNIIASGRLLPVFLQSLEKAINKGVEVDFENHILVVESDEIGFERALEIIKRIKDKGNIQDSSAVILASFITHKKNPTNLELQKQLYDSREVGKFRNSVADTLGGNVPVIYGFPMGHLKYKLTVPMGVEATVDLESGDIKLEESLFSD